MIINKNKGPFPPLVLLEIADNQKLSAVFEVHLFFSD